MSPRALRLGLLGGALALAVAASGCSDPSEPATTGDDAIVGGDAERRFAPVGYLSLDEGDDRAAFDPFCTATLLAPNVVATAAHCTYQTKHAVRPGGPYMTFARGATTSEARRPVRVREIYEDPAWDPTHPEYMPQTVYAHDLALLVLEAPVTGVRPAVLATLGEGDATLAVGYGRTLTGAHELVETGPKQRKSLDVRVAESFAGVHVVDPGEGSLCYGDSGGPLLALPRGVTAGSDARIVGVLTTIFTGGSETKCVPGTRAAYVSLVEKRPFVDAVLAAADAR